MTPNPPRLLLVGGGHASIALLKAARRWTELGVEVTLINDTRHLYYSGMTPEYIGGVYPPAAMRIDLLRWCLLSHVRFIHSHVTSIDVPTRTVRTGAGDVVPCDLAVFDIGASNPLQALAGNAVLTKPIHHVERLKAWLDDTLTREQPRRSLVVVGGGPAGTEVMLNVSARLRHSSRPTALQLTLVHPEGRLMPQFAPALGRRAQSLLCERGVQLHLNCKVTRVDADSVMLDSGEQIPQDEVLWATGTRGQSLFAEAGFPVTEQGYVRVDRSLRVVGHPWAFAAGDCASVEGLQLDRSGVNAVKQGLTLRAHVTRLLRAWRAGRDVMTEPLRPFRPYPVAPYLISTGAPEALLALGPHVGLRGRPLLWLKHLADRVWISRYHHPD